MSGKRDHADRAPLRQQRRADRAARAHQLHDAHRLGLGPRPGGHLGRRVPGELGGPGGEGTLGQQRPGRRDPVRTQSRQLSRPGRVDVAERARGQRPVSRRQEHDAALGERGDDQPDDLVEQLAPVAGGGHQRPGPHQERQPLPAVVGLGPRGPGTGEQLGPFPLGALAGGQVDDERGPAQRPPVDCRRPDQRPAPGARRGAGTPSRTAGRRPSAAIPRSPRRRTRPIPAG